jgi:hypothetical protein
MTNTMKLYTVTRAFIGLVLSAKAIRLLAQESFPGTPDGSLLVSDHSRVRNAQGALVPIASQSFIYADGLFEKTDTGYKVLADNEIQRKPSTRGNRGVSDAAILAAAKAMIAKPSAPATPAPIDAELQAQADMELAELDAATTPAPTE